MHCCCLLRLTCNREGQGSSKRSPPPLWSRQAEDLRVSVMGPTPAERPAAASAAAAAAVAAADCWRCPAAAALPAPAQVPAAASSAVLPVDTAALAHLSVSAAVACKKQQRRWGAPEQQGSPQLRCFCNSYALLGAPLLFAAETAIFSAASGALVGPHSWSRTPLSPVALLLS